MGLCFLQTCLSLHTRRGSTERYTDTQSLYTPGCVCNLRCSLYSPLISHCRLVQILLSKTTDKVTQSLMSFFHSSMAEKPCLTNTRIMKSPMDMLITTSTRNSCTKASTCPTRGQPVRRAAVSHQMSHTTPSTRLQVYCVAS